MYTHCFNGHFPGVNLVYIFDSPPLFLNYACTEYQLRLGRQRQVWLIPLADEKQGVQVNTVLSLDNACYT